MQQAKQVLIRARNIANGSLAFWNWRLNLFVFVQPVQLLILCISLKFLFLYSLSFCSIRVVCIWSFWLRSWIWALADQLVTSVGAVVLLIFQWELLQIFLLVKHQNLLDLFYTISLRLLFCLSNSYCICSWVIFWCYRNWKASRLLFWTIDDLHNCSCNLPSTHKFSTALHSFSSSFSMNQFLPRDLMIAAAV